METPCCQHSELERSLTLLALGNEQVGGLISSSVDHMKASQSTMAVNAYTLELGSLTSVLGQSIATVASNAIERDCLFMSSCIREMEANSNNTSATVYSLIYVPEVQYGV
jgi:hypothetical protein